MQVTSPNTRIDAVDAMRGFALAGIVFAHMIEQYIGGPRPVDWAIESNIFDQIVFGFDLIFVMGKFFSIFSILFGMSFAIMMGNAAAKGHSFSGRFIWRLTILGGIGFVHSLFYRGDILTIYVAIGLFLPLFYSLSNKTLWFIICLLCLGSGRYIFFLLTGSPTILSYDYAPESPVVAAYVEILQNGSLIDDTNRQSRRLGRSRCYLPRIGGCSRGWEDCPVADIKQRLRLMKFDIDCQVGC